eukprot:CAMPEP_0177610322 /NCGR_PEP_ID=MMETSP0419_2-20121207/19697_1 /TAXON_ID=582737 /ORGANISM="Tetraselmis sp., Strain GSL018" /LENGTH=83 /DNA_ID=CAMNT_0019105579 /DNA_START=227 /DNA_END=478 /DNA_ORIENTATION=-
MEGVGEEIGRGRAPSLAACPPLCLAAEAAGWDAAPPHAEVVSVGGKPAGTGGAPWVRLPDIKLVAHLVAELDGLLLGTELHAA